MATQDKELKIFDFLNQIFYKKNAHEYDKKIASGYMLSMWLSHDQSLIDIVNKLNSLQFSLKDDIIYKYYMDKVPKGKRFIKWAKKTPKNAKFDKDVKEMMDSMGLSKREAMMVIKMKEKI